MSEKKLEYKVLKGLEFPRGTVHKVDEVLELTDEEASKFAKGLIKKVESKKTGEERIAEIKEKADQDKRDEIEAEKRTEEKIRAKIKAEEKAKAKKEEEVRDKEIKEIQKKKTKSTDDQILLNRLMRDRAKYNRGLPRDLEKLYPSQMTMPELEEYCEQKEIEIKKGDSTVIVRARIKGFRNPAMADRVALLERIKMEGKIIR